MIELVLDGAEIKTREDVHRCFVEALHFPEWYGANLDALYDCLTDSQEDVRILLLHREILEERLGSYAEKLQRVLVDASAENSHLKILRELQ